MVVEIPLGKGPPVTRDLGDSHRIVGVADTDIRREGTCHLHGAPSRKDRRRWTASGPHRGTAWSSANGCWRLLPPVLR
jgi:hypothetical protein